MSLAPLGRGTSGRGNRGRARILPTAPRDKSAAGAQLRCAHRLRPLASAERSGSARRACESNHRACPRCAPWSRLAARAREKACPPASFRGTASSRRPRRPARAFVASWLDRTFNLDPVSFDPGHRPNQKRDLIVAGVRSSRRGKQQDRKKHRCHHLHLHGSVLTSLRNFLF